MKNLPSQFSIHVKNEKQSREAQEKLFELGYTRNYKKEFFDLPLASSGNNLQINYFNSDSKEIYYGYETLVNHYSFKEFMEIAEQGSKGDSSPLKIFCIPNKTEAALICKWVEERGMDSYSESNYANCFMLGRDNHQPFDRIGSKEGAESNGYKLVSVFEFICALGQIPVPQKPVEIEVLPWKVVIRGDEFDIGCKKDNEISILRNVLECFGRASNPNFGSSWFNMNVVGGRDGFRADNQFVSWEKWDKFVEEVKKHLK